MVRLVMLAPGSGSAAALSSADVVRRLPGEEIARLELEGRADASSAARGAWSHQIRRSTRLCRRDSGGKATKICDAGGLQGGDDRRNVGSGAIHSAAWMRRRGRCRAGRLSTFRAAHALAPPSSAPSSTPAGLSGEMGGTPVSDDPQRRSVTSSEPLQTILGRSNM